MDWQKASAELTKRLDPANVKKGGGNFGPKGDYIEGWLAIQEANRIFGHDGWSYTIDLRQDDLREGKTSKGDPQWQAAYTCVCTVTVGDVVRQDVGFGSGFAKGIGDAIEGATKEAATDALKRALRTFGNPFGLALYDKSRENVGAPEPEQPALDVAAVKAWLLRQIDKPTTVEALDKVLAHETYRANLSKLYDGGAVDAAKEAVEAAQKKRATLRPADGASDEAFDKLFLEGTK